MGKKLNEISERDVLVKFYEFNTVNNNIKEIYMQIKAYYYQLEELNYEFIKFEKLRIKKELNIYESNYSKICKSMISGLAIAIIPVYIQSIIGMMEINGWVNYIKFGFIALMYLGTFLYLTRSFNKERVTEDTKSLMLNLTLEVLEEIELDLETCVEVEFNSDMNKYKNDKLNAKKKTKKNRNVAI